MYYCPQTFQTKKEGQRKIKERRKNKEQWERKKERKKEKKKEVTVWNGEWKKEGNQ